VRSVDCACLAVTGRTRDIGQNWRLVSFWVLPKAPAHPEDGDGVTSQTSENPYNLTRLSAWEYFGCFLKHKHTLKMGTELLPKRPKTLTSWRGCPPENISLNFVSAKPSWQKSINLWPVSDFWIFLGKSVVLSSETVPSGQHNSHRPNINPLKPELNPICYLLALLGAHHFFHVSRIRVKLLTFRLLMSYIYGAPILDVSRSHTTTQHSR